ncbi:MAG: T9SS type A sorting domain-containing protein [Bacteroidota bacterium]
MQRIFTFCLLACLFVASTTLTAQETRFVDPIFDNVTAELNVTYAQNISILTGEPALTDIQMDVYQPDGDDEGILRPVVIAFHTGNFLPAYLNGGAYGTRLDSANVTLLKGMAQRGYVAISASYRQGWLPLAEDQTTRTETLLKAAYRGGQDAHSLVRYLKGTAADENPYLIDTTRMVMMGFGTGGYVALTHAFLDRQEEIAANLQFYDEEGNVLVNPALDGDPFGLEQAPLNVPTNVGHTSDVAMTVNIGGALGDPNWIEGADREPMVLGYHSFTDPFAPFYTGTVIVPTTGNTVVDGVAGTSLVIERAESFGLNDALADANAPMLPEIYPALSSVLNQINAAYKAQTVMSPVNMTGDEFPLSRDNMFPNVYSRLIAGPYNWFDRPTLEFILSQFPMEIRPDINAIIDGEEFSNPNWMDRALAEPSLDTMIAHMIPRFYIGMDLANPISSTVDLVSNEDIGFQVAPNPASSYVLVNTEEAYDIREAILYDLSGRAVSNYKNINTNTLRIERGNLPRGQYVLKIRVDQGVSSRMILFE